MLENYEYIAEDNNSTILVVKNLRTNEKIQIQYKNIFDTTKYANILDCSTLGAIPLHYSTSTCYNITSLHSEYNISAFLHMFKHKKSMTADIGFPTKTGLSLKYLQNAPFSDIHKTIYPNSNVKKFKGLTPEHFSYLLNFCKIAIFGDITPYYSSPISPHTIQGFKYWPCKILNQKSTEVSLLLYGLYPNKQKEIALSELLQFVAIYEEQYKEITRLQILQWFQFYKVPISQKQLDNIIYTPIVRGRTEDEVGILIPSEKTIHYIKKPFENKESNLRQVMIYGDDAAFNIRKNGNTLENCVFKLNTNEKTYTMDVSNKTLIIPPSAELSQKSISIMKPNNKRITGVFNLVFPKNLENINTQFLYSNSKITMINNLNLDITNISFDMQCELMAYALAHNITRYKQSILCSIDNDILQECLFLSKRIIYTDKYDLKNINTVKTFENIHDKDTFIKVIDTILDIYYTKYNNINKLGKIRKKERIDSEISKAITELKDIDFKWSYNIMTNNSHHILRDTIPRLFIPNILIDYTDLVQEYTRNIYSLSLWYILTGVNPLDCPFVTNIGIYTEGNRIRKSYELNHKNFYNILYKHGIDINSIPQSKTYKYYKIFLNIVNQIQQSELYTYYREQLYGQFIGQYTTEEIKKNIYIDY